MNIIFFSIMVCPECDNEDIVPLSTGQYQCTACDFVGDEDDFEVEETDSDTHPDLVNGDEDRCSVCPGEDNCPTQFCGKITMP